MKVLPDYTNALFSAGFIYRRYFTFVTVRLLGENNRRGGFQERFYYTPPANAMESLHLCVHFASQLVEIYLNFSKSPPTKIKKFSWLFGKLRFYLQPSLLSCSGPRFTNGFSIAIQIWWWKFHFTLSSILV